MLELVVKVVVGGLLTIWGIEIVAGLALIVYAARGSSEAVDPDLDVDDQLRSDDLSASSTD